MNRTRTLALALFLLTAIGCTPVLAGGGIPVVVMAEDSDTNSVRRSSDIFYRVIGETKELMKQYDFYVIDEYAVASDLGWSVNDRRPRGESVEFVKLACQTGDASVCPRAMVLLKIRASAQSKSFGTKAAVRITGEILDSATNGFLGGWEPVRREFPAPRDCPRLCLEEVIGDNAREVAISLADVLRKKLAYLTRGGTTETLAAQGGDSISTAYLFNFRYFTMGDIHEITGVMENEFPCFEQVRGSSGDDVNYKYNYVSCAPSNKLQRWVGVLLTDMGYSEGDFKITVTGQREFRVEKIVGNPVPRESRGSRFN